ncbi:MAG: hypothetical protein JWM41_3524 [Gemmatimonadetes bacterium]|nr:hypothetical protein [Gemmatimonadota bacterium]
MKSHAQHRQPDHSKGDESTIGGYSAVHDRPAAFEGSDGYSYSVELIVEETGDAEAVWGGFILFVKWGRLGAQSPEGHVESDYLVHADTEADARTQLGQISLAAVKTLLDQLVAERSGGRERPWWDAMRDESVES